MGRAIITVIVAIATGFAVLVGSVAPARATGRGCSVLVDQKRRTGSVVAVAYCRVLGRPVDQAGLAYWVDRMERGADVNDLTRALAESPESIGRGGRPAASVLAALGRTVEPLSSGLERFATNREMVAEGVEWTSYSLDGREAQVVAVDLGRARPRVSPGDRGPAPVGRWAAEVGGVVAVNGNWFGPWDGPAVSAGRAYAGADHAYTALFGFTVDGEVIVDHHTKVVDEIDPRIVDGVSGHPTLIHRGALTTDFGGDPTFTRRHPRTAIGVDATGKTLFLVTVDGRSRRSRGMTGAETADLLARLGASEAVMLDGGGSTTMWIAGRGVVNRPSEGLRPVGNQLAIVPTPSMGSADTNRG